MSNKFWVVGPASYTRETPVCSQGFICAVGIVGEKPQGHLPEPSHGLHMLGSGDDMKKSPANTLFGISRDFFLALVCIGVLTWIILPNFTRATYRSGGHRGCTTNLKEIDGAKATWALELDKKPGDYPSDSDLFGPDKYIREKPICPDGGVYILGKVGEPPRCSHPGPGHNL